MVEKEIKQTKYSLKRTQKKLISRLYNLSVGDKGFLAMESTLRKSQNVEFTQIGRKELQDYDESWINTLEDCCNAIDVIRKNPSRFIKEVREVVPIAKAKKITEESLIHLSSHTQFIRSVDEKGNVTPEKILSLFGEDDYAIYENRFVYTLIKKLILFIERRYTYINNYVKTKDSDTLTTKSKVKFNGFVYELETKAKMISDTTNPVEKERNQKYLSRIVAIRKRVNFYLTCDFVKLLGSDVKPVRNPIMKTNLLAKNPYYKTCLRTWKFIDAYSKMGVKFSVKEVKKKFDKNYLKDLYALTIANMLTLQAESIDEKQYSSPSAKVKVYLPKTRPVIDDELFDDTQFKAGREDKIVVYCDKEGVLNKNLAKLDDEKAKNELAQIKKLEQDKINKQKEIERQIELKKKLAEQKRIAREKAAKLKAEKLAKEKAIKAEKARIEAEKLAKIKKELEEADLLAKARAKVTEEGLIAKEAVTGKKEALPSQIVVENAKGKKVKIDIKKPVVPGQKKLEVANKDNENNTQE